MTIKTPLVNGDRIDLQYGLYQIIAGEVGSTFKAAAYVGRRKVAESSGDTADGTINSLKAYLDVRTANHRQGRKGGVPTSAEFRDALAALRPSVPLHVMELLTTHSRLPAGTATLSQLERLSSGSASGTVEIEYTRLGRKISRILDFTPGANSVAVQLGPVLVLATPQKSAREDAWKLRSELCEALAELDGMAPANKGGERSSELAERSV